MTKAKPKSKTKKPVKIVEPEVEIEVVAFDWDTFQAKASKPLTPAQIIELEEFIAYFDGLPFNLQCHIGHWLIHEWLGLEEDNPGDPMDKDEARTYG